MSGTVQLMQAAAESGPIHGFIGALIGGAVSLIGGAISSSAEKKAQAQAAARQDTTLQRLKADAKAAGFNPLTALMATGGGAHSDVSFIRPSVGMAQGLIAAGDIFASHMAKVEDRRHEAKLIAAQNVLDEGYMARLTTPVMTGGNAGAMPIVGQPVQDNVDKYVKLPDTVKDRAIFPVKLPDGRDHNITPRQAEYLGVQPGGLYTGGMYSEIWDSSSSGDITETSPFLSKTKGRLTFKPADPNQEYLSTTTQNWDQYISQTIERANSWIPNPTWLRPLFGLDN